MRSSKESVIFTLLLLEFLDKTAVVQFFDDARVDDRVWICGSGARIVPGEEFEDAIHSLERRIRRIFEITGSIECVRPLEIFCLCRRSTKLFLHNVDRFRAV